MTGTAGRTGKWWRALLLVVLLPPQSGCLDGTGPAGVASIGAPTLAIRNGTERAIWFVQIRPCGTSDWSRDLLGAAVVAAGQRVERAVTSGCSDIRLTTEPGSAGAVTWSGLDLRSGATVDRTLETWSQRQ